MREAYGWSSNGLEIYTIPVLTGVTEVIPQTTSPKFEWGLALNYVYSHQNIEYKSWDCERWFYIDELLIITDWYLHYCELSFWNKASRSLSFSSLLHCDCMSRISDMRFEVSEWQKVVPFQLWIWGIGFTLLLFVSLVLLPCCVVGWLVGFSYSCMHYYNVVKINFESFWQTW